MTPSGRQRRSILNGNNQVFALNRYAGATVDSGLAYDVADDYTITGLAQTTGSFDSDAPDDNIIAPSTDFATVTPNETVTVTYALNSPAANGQTGTPPATTAVYDVYAPFFYGTSAADPTTITITGTGDVHNIAGFAVENNNAADGTSVSLSGTVGETIYFVLPSSITSPNFRTNLGTLNPTNVHTFTTNYAGGTDFSYTVWRVGATGGFTQTTTYTLGGIN